MKTVLYFLYTFLALACIGGSVFLTLHKKPAPVVAPVVVSHKDISYIIDGKIIQFSNGIAETDPPVGSTAKTVLRYFGNEVKGDLNSDGKEDIAFLLTKQSSGTSVFYYVVVALGKSNGYSGTNAILLGDRIAPATSEIHGNELVINYADRKQGEPFSETPSTAITKYFVIKNDQLVKETKPVTYTSTSGLSVDVDGDTTLGYTIQTNYSYRGFGQDNEIKGISFVIPESLTTSNNLISDSYISVESLISTSTCAADLFLVNQVAPAKLVTEDGVRYSVASGDGAAAGNRYEETVYALQDTVGSCIAIRYFIHSGAIENYQGRSVSEFDKQALLSKFDAIRKSIVIR